MIQNLFEVKWFLLKNRYETRIELRSRLKTEVVQAYKACNGFVFGPGLVLNCDLTDPSMIHLLSRITKEGTQILISS